MVVYLILIFFLLLFCWIFFVPIRLVINTGEKQFYIKQAGLFTVRFETDETELLYVKINIFFISFNVYPIRDYLAGKEKEPGEKKKKKSKEKEKRKTSIRMITLFFKIAKRTLSTFKLEKLIVNLDTGDVVTNACLFPVGEISSGENIQLSINNSNQFYLDIIIRNSVFMIVLAVVKSIIKHHIHKTKN